MQLKKKFFFLLIIFSPGILHAKLVGQPYIDSSIKELNSEKYKNIEDSNKATICYRISNVSLSVNFEEGIKYGEMGVAMAEKIGWKRGVGKLSNNLGLNYKGSGNFPKAMECFNRALKIDREVGNGEDMANALLNIGTIYSLEGNYPKALDYYEQALQAYKDGKYVYFEAATLSSIGTIYEQQSNSPKALEYFFRALEIAEQFPDKEMEVMIDGNIGATYSGQNNYQKALEYYFKSKKMAEARKDDFMVAWNNGNIGATYQSLGDYQDALKYSFMALEAQKKIGNKDQVAQMLGNIGTTSLSLKDYPAAIAYTDKSLQMNKTLGDVHNIADALCQMGNAYLAIVADSAARVASATECKMYDGTVQTVNIPAGKGARLHAAKTYLGEGIDSAKKIGAMDVLATGYEGLVKALRLNGEYREALAGYDSLVKIKDSVLSADNKVKFANEETKREAELKQKQIEINGIQAIKKQHERGFYMACLGLLLLPVVIMLRNNTMQKRANRQLLAEKAKSDTLTDNLQDTLQQRDELVAQLALSAKMKSRFLANISHELRTPVTLLTGMLELMKDNRQKGAATDKDKMDVAYNNSRKLQRMLEEILSLSKLENTETSLKYEIKEMAPLLKRMAYAFETLIEKEKLTLAYDGNAIQGLYVLLDEDKFEKIINNLIYNAVKYNRSGGWVKVTARASADKKQVIIEVSNSGSGICKEDLPHIFDRYYQGESRSSKAEGVGIGLSLVKEFTLLLGGTVHVASSEADGTTFTMQFPVTEKKAADEETDGQTALPMEKWEQFAAQQSVLIVEDNSEMRYYLRQVLGGRVNLAEAGNGKEALKWMETNTPDLIISDIMMPEMDGREFIGNLKKSDNYKKIPVITLTALADKESHLGMLRMGVDDYIVKPFNADELRIRAYNLLNNHALREAFNEQPAEPEDIPAASKEAEEFRNKITEYVLARLKNTNVSVYDLAYELALSERQLYRLAKSLTGCSPAQLIKEVRLQKAYELLVSGQITKIEDVANRVGFETAGYFSKQFLERFGKRATEFL